MTKVDRKQIVNAIFEVTGEKVNEFDPVVTASMYFAHEIRSAGVDASQRIAAASMSAMMAARRAEAVCASVGADQGKFLRELSGRSRPGETRPLAAPHRSAFAAPPTRTMFSFLAGAASVTLLAFAAGILDFSRTDEAALGRAFIRALPTLDQDVKVKLLEHMKKSLP